MANLHIHRENHESYCGAPVTRDEHGSLFFFERELVLQSIRTRVKSAEYFKEQICPACWKAAGMP